MDWSFGDVLWTMVGLYFWGLLIWMFITAFGDIFRRDELSGAAKALWIALLVIFPFFGALIYILWRPAGSGAGPDLRPITGVDQPRMPIH